MKQTAVDWLLKQITEEFAKTPSKITFNPLLINQAKEMEKEQIIMAYKADWHPCSDEDAEQYYNETYKQDEQNQ